MSYVNLEIPPDKFYCEKNERLEIIENLIKETKNEISPKKSFVFLRRLLGPSHTWKVFKKQSDALEFCTRRRNGLMCFAFEDINNSRMFLVAHPKVFWASNYHRFFKKCNTYEIIREFAACKLYLDIEFDFKCNQSCDGRRMLNNFQKIVNFNLSHYFGIHCTESDILDLDSSSSVKFSHHVIYQIKNVFQDNYAVGNFLKQICEELKGAYEANLNSNNTELLKLSTKYGLLSEEILELFIKDKKNKIKLFVDEGVYTKNRHFRILGSSKKCNKVPLHISKFNKYKFNSSTDTYECSMFLDSLITYFSWEIDKILEFGPPKEQKKGKFIFQTKSTRNRCNDSENTQLYPQIDVFITNLVFPKGRIRKKICFNNASRLVYEIQGFRYCENIKKEHRSNNILFVVDLQNLVFYQKCYDPECNNFRSTPTPLPEEIRFYFEEDNLNINELENRFKHIEDNFENDIPDEELSKIADCAEAIAHVNW